ncbi:hypothetical protein [Oxobacter pfennigii]|uniref:hypothetical protein n=1 Tax=Oxobacter pfennigii TaxID=36849 RepID=UPI0006D409F2|nr:hypothetical protein [Oxobacter pfennigii]
MDIKKAKKIISYVVQVTEPRWRKYDECWADIDELIIRRGYEQGGFEFFKLVPLLKKSQIYTIDRLGSVMGNYKSEKKYQRDYAGGLESTFYTDLKQSRYGQVGNAFYLSIEEFLNTKAGKPGSRFWSLLWQMLICTHYLKENYNSSFSNYLRKKFSQYKGTNDVLESYILECSKEGWEDFKLQVKPWNELYGIGENVFDFILGDLKEADGITTASFKLDVNNIYFFQATGIDKLIKEINREEVINFINSLDMKYSLREVNKGIYTYCSLTESYNYGFCRSREKCIICPVSNICEKQIG